MVEVSEVQHIGDLNLPPGYELPGLRHPRIQEDLPFHYCNTIHHGTINLVKTHTIITKSGRW